MSPSCASKINVTVRPFTRIASRRTDERWRSLGHDDRCLVRAGQTAFLGVHLNPSRRLVEGDHLLPASEETEVSFGFIAHRLLSVSHHSATETSTAKALINQQASRASHKDFLGSYRDHATLKAHMRRQHRSLERQYMKIRR